MAPRFFRMQLVQFPLGDGTYQQCHFIGVDTHGVATVKTRGGRYRTVWDCNLYPVPSVAWTYFAERHPEVGQKVTVEWPFPFEGEVDCIWQGPEHVDWADKTAPEKWKPCA